MKNLILDGNNLIHRTHWTAKNAAGDDLEKLNSFHVYFTLNAIKSYVDMFKPDKIYVCWDEKPNYQVNERKSIYSDYKGNRSGDSTPHQNNSLIKEFLVCLGIPSIYPERLEADDCVSYLCDTLEGKSVIVSVDKDFLQLVDERVTLYSPISKVYCTLDNFQEVAKCTKEEFVFIKCLQGDKSDNVPGIPRFGKKKVQAFLDKKILLTEEQLEIYTRNYELFRLDRYKDAGCGTERAWLERQLSEANTMCPNYQTFIQLCIEHKLNNILSKKDNWFNLFFVKHKLRSLFE